MGSLTAVGVKNAKPGRHGDGEGLYLVVRPTGSRAWVLRIQAEGRRQDVGLGSANSVSLIEAREKARALRRSAREGSEVITQRVRLDAVAPTFGEAAIACHAAMRDGWRNAKHAAQWIQTLRTYMFPTIEKVRVDQVDSPLIRDALAPIWLVKPETAKRVHQRVASVLDFAQSKGWRTGDAPTRSVLKGLPRQKISGRHFASMPFADVPELMRHLRACERTAGRGALQFAILTAARSGEVRGATWAEIDLVARTWSVPAARMKAHREHVVPLSDSVIHLLEHFRPLAGGEMEAPLFPAPRGGSLSDMTLSKVLRDAGVPFTVHGFRSSFRDWAAEETDTPSEIVEKALAHAIPNKVEAAYRRTDYLKKRATLMDHWSAFLES